MTPPTPVRLYRFVIDGPGSHGELLLSLTGKEAEFLSDLSLVWNKSNHHHAQPVLTLTERSVK